MLLNESEEELELAYLYKAEITPDRVRGIGYYKYSIKDIHIWKAVKWVVARLQNGRYVNHKHFDDIETAFAEASALAIGRL